MKQERCLLRPLTESDQEIILRWRNSERVRQNMYTDHVISEEEHVRWFKKALHMDVSRHLMFEYEGRPLGLVSFTKIDEKDQICTWAFYLGEKDVPMGAGSAMEYCSLTYAFDILKIRKLWCEVFSYNTGVIKLHGKFGFNQEACYVAHRWKNNNFLDVIGLSLFRESWQTNKDKLRSQVFRDKSIVK
jgi:UDP-4-amino-4,6-dideoxy-N-acetyl-beta-L-altrosamine N-acetyltransferase